MVNARRRHAAGQWSRHSACALHHIAAGGTDGIEIALRHGGRRSDCDAKDCRRRQRTGNCDRVGGDDGVGGASQARRPASRPPHGGTAFRCPASGPSLRRPAFCSAACAAFRPAPARAAFCSPPSRAAFCSAPCRAAWRVASPCPSRRASQDACAPRSSSSADRAARFGAAPCGSRWPQSRRPQSLGPQSPGGASPDCAARRALGGAPAPSHTADRTLGVGTCRT